MSQRGSPVPPTDVSNRQTDSVQMMKSDDPKRHRLQATNSCTKIIRTQAGIFAISHPHKKTGYKEPMSETNARTLGGLTTYRQFYELGVELPTMQKKQSPHVKYKQKLVPYNPIATCNRLPVKFENEPVPHARFCAPRNVSQFDIGTKPYERRFLTHNHAFYPQWQSLPIGFENAGVMSDFARRIHVGQDR
mmetsp:Transcript_36180/g.72975  ORF Transcript_36180/g.72975 Transcript_36180/m.72975 type:complete len:191 (+) Transcript_36180:55-627(+)